MTTYALDTTGALSANAITGEAHVVNTIGQAVPSLLFLTQPLFYATGLVVAYTDADGATATLVLGDDYSLIFEIDGVVTNNKIFGAIKINNFQLNGTLSVGYQTVGGQWSVLQKPFTDFLNNNYYSPRQGYVSVTPLVPIYAGASTSPIVLNSAAALTLAQTTGPLPVSLTPVILPLPNSRKTFVEAGLVVDGNGLQKVS